MGTVQPLPSPRTDPTGPVPAAEVVERFVRLLQGEGRSRWTVKQYAFTARHFLAWVDKPMGQVTPQDLERWREYLVLQRHYAKSSVYASLRALEALFRAFRQHAADGVELPRRPERLPTYLSEEEMSRLLAQGTGSVEDDALLRVLAYGGLRVGEICRLTWEDVDVAEGLLKVRGGKGDKDRMVVVEETTLSALASLRAEREAHPTGDLRVFPVSRETVERRVRTLAEAAGLSKHVTPHTLRHTLATALLRRGLDLRFIQKQLGHASVATTQLYTHVDTGALQEAYRAAKPTYGPRAAAARADGSAVGAPLPEGPGRGAEPRFG
jgi:integrase/recombinase XerD